ncbi:MAG TPA: STAS domain-containing protein [Bryobacteraceae bacterium]|nr:STAS domain-containing protein [Bryobacteraceae bacterium]
MDHVAADGVQESPDDTGVGNLPVAKSKQKTRERLLHQIVQVRAGPTHLPGQPKPDFWPESVDFSFAENGHPQFCQSSLAAGCVAQCAGFAYHSATVESGEKDAVLNIQSAKLDKAILLKVSGRMDAENADRFRRACEGLAAEGVQHVIADLNELRYVSSMGLRAFLHSAQTLRARSGSLVLCGLNGVPRQVFEMTNLLGLFPVFETSADAIAAL